MRSAVIDFPNDNERAFNLITCYSAIIVNGLQFPHFLSGGEEERRLQSGVCFDGGPNSNNNARDLHLKVALVIRIRVFAQVVDTDCVRAAITF